MSPLYAICQLNATLLLLYLEFRAGYENNIRQQAQHWQRIRHEQCISIILIFIEPVGVAGGRWSIDTNSYRYDTTHVQQCRKYVTYNNILATHKIFQPYNTALFIDGANAMSLTEELRDVSVLNQIRATCNIHTKMVGICRHVLLFTSKVAKYCIQYYYFMGLLLKPCFFPSKNNIANFENLC